MRLPVIAGVIERRLLVNFRVAPDVLARTLPAPFRPRLHNGHGVVGICLIRLAGVRPRWLPAWTGLRSENAAHRAAVEWHGPNGVEQGVYVRRRDTGLWLNALAGGRVFPGIHSLADFAVDESENRFDVRVQSRDASTSMHVTGTATPEWPADSIFASPAEASAFFEAGVLGYSDTPDPNRFQGLELRCHDWKAEPLAVSEVRSSYFDDRTVFPDGLIEFDCALLMRNIAHEWHGRADLRGSAPKGTGRDGKTTAPPPENAGGCVVRSA